MTPKSNRTPLLYYVKLCVSFQIHRWIQTGVTVRKRWFRVKIGDFSSRITLKFDGWPWKTAGHLFYATRSFVHHFKALGEFKLELQSGNAQFRSKSAIFFPVWPWNLMDDLGKQQGTSSMLLQALCIISQPLVNSNWSHSPEAPTLGQNRRLCESCDCKIWQMTLKNNRAHLLHNMNICASSHSHIPT